MCDSSAAIWAGGSVKSTHPDAMALAGMLENWADAGSCANVMPPSALMASSPRVPSEAVPDSTTPMALLFRSSASETKNPSMGRSLNERGDYVVRRQGTAERPKLYFKVEDANMLANLPEILQAFSTLESR